MSAAEIAPAGTPGLAAVVFDKDGTLFDFQATWGQWSRGFLEAEAGGDPARLAVLATVVGYDLTTDRFARDSLVIAHPVDEIAAALLPHFPCDDLDSLIARMNARAETAPQVPAVDLHSVLGGLRARGLALGVATNDGEAPARAHLAQAGVMEMFDFIAGYDSGHGAKPGPGPLLAFARAVGVPAAACVMVGDSRHDLIAARAAGMRGVGVLTGYAQAEDLAPLATVVLPSIAELPGWIAAQG